MPDTYLLTGGAGFIGSHLADVLVRRGSRVVALDDLSTGDLANIAHVSRSGRFEFVHGSVLDSDLVDELVGAADVVVHLAAAVGVTLVLAEPLTSFTTNLVGSQTVIAAAHRHRRRIIVVSSSEVYGKNDTAPLGEHVDLVLGQPTTGRWSYAVAKAAAEVLAFQYAKDRGLAATVVRLFNTVGPRQSPSYGMVLPRLMAQAMGGSPLTVYGTGAQTRCFCHVADVVEGIVAVAEHDAAVGEPFNIGSTEEVSILELAQHVKAHVGSSSPIHVVPYEIAFEHDFEDVLRRVPDISKIGELTGWAPRRSLRQVLDDVSISMSTVRPEFERAV